MDKFTIQQASRDAILLHAEDRPHPSELDLDEDGFDAGGFSTVHDFKVGDMIYLVIAYRKGHLMPSLQDRTVFCLPLYILTKPGQNP